LPLTRGIVAGAGAPQREICKPEPEKPENECQNDRAPKLLNPGHRENPRQKKFQDGRADDGTEDNRGISGSHGCT
jgi:hypothetical protein